MFGWRVSGVAVMGGVACLAALRSCLLLREFWGISFLASPVLRRFGC